MLNSTTELESRHVRLAARRGPSGLRTFGWSVAGRLESLTSTSASAGFADTYTLHRDVDGRIDDVTDQDGQHAYTYDATGRLLAATHPGASGLSAESYTYDPAGNRLSWHGNPAAEVVYDAEDRLVQDGSYVYGWDANGRLATREDRSTGAVETFTWNALDQLVSIAYTDVRPTMSYTYDGVGRRVTSTQGAQVRRFLYDGWSVIAVLDETDTVLQWLTYGPQGELLAITTPPTSQTTEVLLNHLGTLRGTWDGAAATWVRADSFGSATTLASDYTPAALTWHATDASGLVYARARYLDPRTGRFLTEDPREGTQIYAYAWGDPVHNWDPNGMAAFEHGGIASRTGTKTIPTSILVRKAINCVIGGIVPQAISLGLEHSGSQFRVFPVGCTAFALVAEGNGDDGSDEGECLDLLGGTEAQRFAYCMRGVRPSRFMSERARKRVKLRTQHCRDVAGDDDTWVDFCVGDSAGRMGL